MNWTNAFADMPAIPGLPVTWGHLLWATVIAVPPLIVLLYFLKLKRQPLEVPSTFLWARSIEDLHVNSIWQRLRRNILLFLQLLLILLAILSLLRPSWQGAQLLGDRFVFVIDNSASMSATDVTPTRLESARQQALKLIDAMKSGDTAMIISFSDTVQVEEGDTSNRNHLRRAIEGIKPSQRSTDFAQALQVVTNMANAPRTADPSNPEDVQAGESRPATMYIFSDGNFTPAGQSLGVLDPKYIPVGSTFSENVAVTEFSTRRNEERADKLHVFALIENFGPEDVTVRCELFLGTATVNVKDVDVGAKSSNGVTFQIDDVEEGVLQLKINSQDDLPLDNVAWTTINTPRPAKVLLLTSGNPAIENALDLLGDRIELEIREPTYLKSEPYRLKAAGGFYDLVVFDRCLPEPEKPDANAPTPLPQANTFILGRVPRTTPWGWQPGESWPPEKVDVPQIIDINREHPIMQLLELGNVRIAEGTPLKPPPGGRVLIDTIQGPIFAIGPREGFEDAVLGFEFITEKQEIVTDWPVRLSFPVFINNLVQYMGNRRGQAANTAIHPGKPVEIQLESAGKEVTIIPPNGSPQVVQRSVQGTYHFTHADQVGVYEVRDNDRNKTVFRFAVNLFDSQESNILPRPEIQLTKGTRVQAEPAAEPARRETWKYLLLLALIVLLIEWYIYNRRVYL